MATREGLWKESHGIHTEIGGRAELVLIHSACQSFESMERLPALTMTHMGKPGVGSAWGLVAAGDLCVCETVECGGHNIQGMLLSCRDQTPALQ